METKRCTYCHKLQRVESQACSRCGHSFERRKSKGERSWYSSGSLFSLPPASPHHAGHYSGLHPEDQPYQSNKIVTPQRFLDDILEKESLQEPLEEEAEKLILPSTENDLVLNWDDDISQVPIGRKIPPRRSRQQLASDSTLPGNRATQEKKDRDIPRRQITRPFVQDVLPVTPQAQSVEASLAPTEVVPATYEQGLVLTEIQQPLKIQEIDDAYASQLLLEDQSFPSTNNAALLPEDLPSYMQEALRTRRGPSHIMSTVLLAVGCSVLLATSIIVLVLMGTRPNDLHAQLKVTPRTLGIHDSFSLEGNGFTPNQRVTFTIDANTVVDGENSQPLRANTDAQGRFSSQGTVPSTWSIGKHVIYATDPVSAQRFPADITVQADLPTPPHLQLSTTQANFGASPSSVVSSQTITLENSGGGHIVWQESSDQPWLTTSLKGGTFTVSENIQVTVNRQGRDLGDYTGHVTFWLPGQENAPSVLTVTMTVEPTTAQLSLSATSLAYATAQSHIPESQVITIGNTGEQALHWNATVSTQDGAPWLTLSLSGGVLSSGASQALTVQVKSQTLPVGTYHGLISFTGDADAQVGVVLTVVAPGNLVVSPSSLALTTEQGDQTLSLQNSGGLSLDWTVEPSTNTGRNWLSVAPASGRLAPGESVNITAHAHDPRLTPGSYQGMLTFSVGDQTKQVSVSFVVTRRTPAPKPTPTPVSTPTPTPTLTSTSTSTSTPTSTPTPTSTQAPRIFPTEPSDTDRHSSYAGCNDWKC
jgi:hypothetical protein